MTIGGTHGPGRSKDVLRLFSERGIHIIWIQETLRHGVSLSSQEGYVVNCSGNKAGRNDKQGGVGLAVKEGTVRQGTCSQEYIDGRPLTVSFELRCKSKGITFVIVA